MNETPRSKEMTIKGIKKIIETSGYALEIDVADILRKDGWLVLHQASYVDRVTKKVRYADLHAFKMRGLISMGLVLECKKSTKHGWAFHTIDKISEFQGVLSLLADFLIQLKNYEINEDVSNPDKFMSLLQQGLHSANSRTRVGTLCCIPPKHPDDFNEAVYQVLSATESFEESLPKELIFPAIVFDGPMWEFHKNGELIVDPIDYLQCISSTPNGERVRLVDVVRSTFFSDFLGLVNGSLDWLNKNVIRKEEVQTQNE